MTRLTLKSKNDVVEDIANVFFDSPRCMVSIRDNTAFKESSFLSLGDITLSPRQPQTPTRIKEAVHDGMFEWRTPTEDQALDQIRKCIETQSSKPPPGDEFRSVLNLFGSVAVRMHLRHPVFDPHVLSAMPFKKPTTVICDTSAIISGALNFTSKYLTPAARVKIPSVVHMELINLADRFLTLMRSQLKASSMMRFLDNHFRSQAGQRVLLQHELNSDVEMDFPFLLGDPIKSTFKADNRQDFRQFHLSEPIRSYVDRLILETARQHRLQSTPNHQCLLLTSDQGLARMALVEGIGPLYFRSITSESFFGKHFTGVNFHPFTGHLNSTSIPAILWDLAMMTGLAKLESIQGPKRKLEVWTTRKDLHWLPQHSREDLLWTGYSGCVPKDNTNSSSAYQDSRLVPSQHGEDNSGAKPESSQPVSRSSQRPSSAKLLLLNFSVDRMIALIDRLETQQQLSIEDVLGILGISGEARALEYWRFLVSGNVVSKVHNNWQATSALRPIAIAARHGSMREFRECLLTIPVFRALAERFSAHETGSGISLSELGRARATYGALAEVTGLGARVQGRGLFGTPRDPSIAEFSDIAVETYNQLKRQSDWVSTGQWLEHLIAEEGIHPEIARRQLQTCSERGLVRRITEGSTAQTSYDLHSLRVLDVAEGTPFVRTVHLYRGDFLIPGKASSSIKLERIT